MKKLRSLAAIMIILSSTLSSAVIFHNFLKNSEDDPQKPLAIANHVYDTIYEQIMRPLMVSKTMAYDTLLKEKLEKEGDISEFEMAEILSEYLKVIKEKFNYSSTFVVSEKTRRYYTESGIVKVLNPQKVPYDIWYPVFINSNAEYDLDTDRDQANDFLWTVFINYKITGKNGELLGVCGVGVVMDKLQTIITNLEDEFDIKINMIDLEGLVQVDTNTANIENAYVSEAISDGAGSERFSFSRKGLSRVRMVRLMKDLGWYIVVQGAIEKNTINAKIFIILFAQLFLILVIFFAISKFAIKEPVIKPQPEFEDPLTGLPTRSYFKEAYGEMGIFTTTRYKSIAFFDIDSFESISDDLDGEEILRKIVRVSNATFWDKGQLLHWDKDGFLAILEADLKETREYFIKLCKKIENDLGVTISVGIVAIDLSDTIKANYYRAIQACYRMKEHGGNGVQDFGQ